MQKFMKMPAPSGLVRRAQGGNRLSRLTGSAALALALGLLSSCAPSSLPARPAAPASTAPKVVATTSVLCDLARQIAETTIALTCLVKAGEDPHVYQPKPEDRQAIDDAALILYQGYNFEPSLMKLVQASPNPAPKVAVSEIAVPQPLMVPAASEHQGAVPGQKTPADREAWRDRPPAPTGKPDAAPAPVPDPHVWHSARNGIRLVAVIKTQLAQVVPDQAARYEKNAQATTQRLIRLDRWINTQISTIPANRRKLITTHDALGYYAAAYGIPIEGALQGLSTEEKPTAARVKELVDDIQASQVPTIFAEITANPKLLEAVAKEANIKLSDQPLFADGLGEPGSAGDTYEKMLIANTRAIVEGLGGKFTPF